MAARVVETFVAAYRPHVRRVADARGWSRPDDGLLEAAENWLRTELEALLSLHYRQQPRGPLEIFQEAMSFPTEWLAAAGLEPVGRDEVAETALPGDVFDLAPASSRELGEEAWRAHLEWSAAKIAAMTS